MNKKELLKLEIQLAKKIDPFDKFFNLSIKDAKEFFQFQKKEFMKELHALDERVKSLENKKHA
jgi:hypothetical protein